MPVTLFPRLLARTLDETDLPDLAVLAAIPLAQRAPWLGAIDAALDHPLPSLRVAGLRALAGARGLPAFRRMIARLDDPEPDVRRAAVEAMRASCASLPARWALAVLHRDPIVRGATLDGATPLGCASLPLYLLGDPEHAARVALPDGPEVVGTVLAFASRGTLPRARARAWLEQNLGVQLVNALLQVRWRTALEIDPIVDAGDPGVRDDDVLDLALGLWVGEDADAEAAARERFFEGFRAIVLGRVDLARRLAASLLSMIRHRSADGRATLPEPIAAMLGVVHPAAIADGALPREVRLAAVEGLLRHATCSRPLAAIEPLLDQLERQAEIVRRAGGELDLRVLAAAMIAAPEAGSGAAILARFGEDAILDAFVGAPERSAPILAHELRRGARAWLIERACERLPAMRGRIVAMAIAAAPEGELGAIDALEAGALIELALGLDAFLGQPGIRIGPAKQREAAERVAARLAASPDATASTFLARLATRAPHDPGDPDARPPFAESVLGALATALDPARFVACCVALPEDELGPLVRVISRATGVPFGKELALAHALAAHPSPAIAGWAASRTVAPAPPPIPPGVVALSEEEIEAIASAPSEDALSRALAPARAAPCRGLVRALAGRPARASARVCAVLLACHDEPRDVARELERFWSDDLAFARALDEMVVALWEGRAAVLPIAANAWLHLWERHARALVDALAEHPQGLAGALEAALEVGPPFLAAEVWAGVATALETLRFRDRARLEVVAPAALLDRALAEIDAEVGEAAARIVAAIAHARTIPGAIAERLPALEKKLADLSPAVRERLRGVVDATGVAPPVLGPRARATSAEKELIERVRSLADLDELGRLCRGEVARVVHEAALRLLMRGGESGERRIALLLAEPEPVPHALALADAVSLFESEDARDRAEALVRARIGAAARPDLRFAIAMSLAGKLRGSLIGEALAATWEGPAGWLRATDVDRLLERAPARDVMLALAPSPHPHGYERALAWLLAREGDDEAELAAVRAFVEAGPERRHALRLQAAEWLCDRNDRIGAPLLFLRSLASGVRLPTSLVRRVSESQVLALAEGVLCLGPGSAEEHRLVDLVDRLRASASAREGALRRVLEDGSHDVARTCARDLLAPSRARDAKLRAVAEVFAWGAHRSRELTGRVLRFRITDGGALGYATMKTGDVHVTPLPIFRGERDGRTIVEALVLHEIGHHVYHASPEALAIWEKAASMGLSRLLNLVLDEHLERNLRALEGAWGDRLKTLASWAFRHARTDVHVWRLLSTLGADALAVLTRSGIGLARDPHMVRVESGPVLAAMDAGGHSFSRFVTALRMGLGDRSGDAKVREALALFDRSFRRASPERLWEITLALQKLFGSEVDLALHLGGAESITERGGLLESDEGIGDRDVQREVERILQAPPKRASSEAGAGRRGGLQINVGGEAGFSPITAVEVVPPDPAKHAEVARKVRRHASRMRQHLEELGLRFEPERMRLRGHRIDATRLRPLVTRADPRVLVAREVRNRTDLFLGLAIDCSGSMQGASMERAHAFGVLLAEAARELRGIDLRAFGFTDRLILDAGDARRCAITSLRATDGNNDAAALWHVAEVARRSPRRAKLVVMISDGLPTECSVEALRGCVRKVERMGIACAQVAVRPLEEICFPHHVLIDGGELDAAVARFGQVVTGLVRKVMT